MELHELHVHEVRSSVIRKRLAVTGVFPTVAGDPVGAADSTCGNDHGLGMKKKEMATLAVVGQSSNNTVSLFKQRENRALHMHVNPLMDAVILKPCGQKSQAH